MKQTLFVPFPYDIQVLNFYLHSYFADVNIEYGNKAIGDKHNIKIQIEAIELKYFEKA